VWVLPSTPPADLPNYFLGAGHSTFRFHHLASKATPQDPEGVQDLVVAGAIRWKAVLEHE